VSGKPYAHLKKKKKEGKKRKKEKIRKKMLLADFHNHSCLSPCGSLELSPRVLAEKAAEKGVRVLALTDHNSSLNCPAFAKVCLKYNIIPLFGMEATTQEEIHIVCLFTSLEASLAFSEYAYSILTPFPNDPEKTGDQVFVDENDEIMGEVEYYLVNPIEVSVDQIGGAVMEFGGIVIPAHIDRPAFSMTSQLGVVTPGPWSALECVRLPPSPDTLGYPLTTSSDAHYPEHVARRPFNLDISLEELAPNGLEKEADMKALIKALRKRPTYKK
jgi:PHP family Zn ribbon phosphoesterase